MRRDTANLRAAKYMLGVLVGYAEDTRETTEPVGTDDLVGFLTDIRHLCAREGWDFDKAVEDSEGFFAAEERGEEGR